MPHETEFRRFSGKSLNAKTASSAKVLRSKFLMEEYVKPLDDMITNTSLPTLLNTVLSKQDRDFYSLPIRIGDLEILFLSELAESQKP